MIENNLTIWSLHESSKWTQAYPIGNGRLGAMIFGGIDEDLIQLNEDTLWSGFAQDLNNYEAHKYLNQARQLIFDGKLSEARKLIESKMLGKYMQVYLPLGDLIIENIMKTSKSCKVLNYKRELNLNEAVCKVSFDKLLKIKNDNKNNKILIKQEREYFSSFVDQAIFIKYKVATIENASSSSLSKLNLRFKLDSKLKYEINADIERKELILSGVAPSFVDAYNRTNKEKIKYEPEKGMKFEFRLYIHYNDGLVELENSQKDSIIVKNANEVIVAIVAATSFNGYKMEAMDPYQNGKDPKKLCIDYLEKIKNKPYEKIKKDHIYDYQSLFSRVKINLGVSNYKNRPTDLRIIRLRSKVGFINKLKYYLNIRFFSLTRKLVGHFLGSWSVTLGSAHGSLFEKKGRLSIAFKKQSANLDKKFYKISKYFDDLDLIALYFQFGRYLIISSSRPGTQAMNLQGIWNDKLIPPWASNYTININTEMNYWPVDVVNLSECMDPLIKLVSELAEEGQKTAKIHYNANGWCAHHNTTIWRNATPVERNALWAFWPMGGVWLCLNLIDHYYFNLNEDYLKNVLYPLIKGACLFLLDWLIEIPAKLSPQIKNQEIKTYLGTCPATSPENQFIDENGKVQAVHYSTTCDMALIREIFIQTIKLIDVLNIDFDFKQKLISTLEKLFPYQIGSKIQLLEWSKEFKEPEPGHRHMSHLIGLHPGTHITPEETPQLSIACRNSLLLRIKYGGGATGWSCAWKINLFARLKDAENTFNSICYLISNSTYENLFDAHPPFQIDGNLGGIAGIAEMLVQSHNDIIEILPALPRQIKEGYVEGLKVRGNLIVNIYWQNNSLSYAILNPKITRIYKIRSKHPIILYILDEDIKNNLINLDLVKNNLNKIEPISVQQNDKEVRFNIFSYKLESGKRYILYEENLKSK